MSRLYYNRCELRFTVLIMKASSMSRRMFCSTSLAASTGQSFLPRGENHADISGAEEFMKKWDQAWGLHDAEALALLHTEDAVTVNRFGTLLQGRGPTEKALAFLHSRQGPFGQSKFPPLKMLALRQLTPDVMVLQTAWQNPVMHPDGKIDPVKVDDMIVTFVLLKTGQGWKVSEIDPHNVEKMDLPYSNPGQKE
jgi:ketosteroid isomerase-like protein